MHFDRIKTLIAASMLFVGGFSFSQDFDASNEVKTAVLDKTKPLLSKGDIDRLADSLERLDQLTMSGEVYHEYAKYLVKADLFLEADSILNHAVRQKRKAAIVDTALLQKSLSNQADYNFRQEKYPESMQADSEVISLEKKSRFLLKSYVRFGRIFEEIGRPYSALEYYALAKELSQNINENQIYIQACLYYAGQLNELEISEESEKALELLNEVEQEYGSEFTVNNELNFLIESANANETLSDYGKAESLLLEMNELAFAEQNDYSQQNALNNLGYLYNKLKKHEKAIGVLDKVISLGEYGNPYDNLGDAYKGLGKHEAAKSAYKKAIFLAKEEGGKNRPEILQYMVDLSSLLVSTSDTGALLALNEADKLLDELLSDNYESQSKEFWRRESRQLYSDAVEFTHNIQDENSLFYFLEKKRAMLLLEALQRNKELSSSSDADRVLLYTLRAKISELEFNEDEMGEKDRAELLKLRSELEELYIQDGKLTGNFFIASRTQAKEYVKNNGPILSFSVSETGDGYAYFMDENTDYSTTIVIDKETIKSWTDKISKPFITEADEEEFFRLGSSLRDQLLGKIDLEKTSRLTIIPDGILSTMSFGALPTEQGNYLIENMEFNYAYSLSTLLASRETKRNSKGILSLSPEHFPYSDLTSLDKYVEDENQDLKQWAGFNLLRGKNANKKAFKKRAEKAGIIHLTTHAGLDNNDPWIALADGYFKLPELYNMNLNAELVFLSACETLKGKDVPGEGLYSLSRGFTYAGVQSVVASLWEVDDKAAADLVKGFYSHYAEGMSKPAALQEAKKKYLATNSGSLRSPYYWSAFVAIGDSAPTALKLKENRQTWILAGLVLLLCGLFFFLRKRKPPR